MTVWVCVGMRTCVYLSHLYFACFSDKQGLDVCSVIKHPARTAERDRRRLRRTHFLHIPPKGLAHAVPTLKIPSCDMSELAFISFQSYKGLGKVFARTWVVGTSPTQHWLPGAGGVLWKVLTRAMGKKDRQEDTVGRQPPHQGPRRPWGSAWCLL